MLDSEASGLATPSRDARVRPDTLFPLPLPKTLATGGNGIGKRAPKALRPRGADAKPFTTSLPSNSVVKRPSEITLTLRSSDVVYGTWGLFGDYRLVYAGAKALTSRTES